MVFSPRTKTNGGPHNFMLPQRGSWRRRRFRIWKKPRCDRLGSCQEPLGVFHGLGTPRAGGQASPVPQPRNTEPAKTTRPRSCSTSTSSVWVLRAPGPPALRSLGASGDVERTRPAAEARPRGPAQLTQGSWHSFPPRRAQTRACHPAAPSRRRRTALPLAPPVTSAPQDASFEGSLGDARDPDLGGPR